MLCTKSTFPTKYISSQNTQALFFNIELSCYLTPSVIIILLTDRRRHMRALLTHNSIRISEVPNHFGRGERAR